MKGLGYLISIVSVFLLAVPAFKSASEEPPMLLCLVAGMAASIAGMFLRWLSHRRQKQEMEALK